MRWHGSRAVCDNVVYAVIKKRITIVTKTELQNIIRACFIIKINRVDQRGRPSTFLTNTINKEWYDGYLRGFHGWLLDKQSL